MTSIFSVLTCKDIVSCIMNPLDHTWSRSKEWTDACYASLLGHLPLIIQNRHQMTFCHIFSDSDECTIDAMEYASIGGNLDVLKWLYANGYAEHADIPRVVWLASENGHIPVVEWCFQTFTNINPDVPFFGALYGNKVNYIRDYIKKANTNIIGTISGIVMQCGNLEMIKLFCSYGDMFVGHNASISNLLLEKKYDIFEYLLDTGKLKQWEWNPDKNDIRLLCGLKLSHHLKGLFLLNKAKNN